MCMHCANQLSAHFSEDGSLALFRNQLLKLFIFYLLYKLMGYVGLKY